MSMVFTTRRSRTLRGTMDDQGRFSAPNTAAELLAQASDIAIREAGLPPPVANLPARIRARLDAGMLGTSMVDPTAIRPDPRLIDQFGPDKCLKYNVLPWRSCAGRVTVLAASFPEFQLVRKRLEAKFGPVHLAFATQDSLNEALCISCHKTLMENAECRTDPLDSCRDWNSRTALLWGLSVVFIIAACLIIWPVVSFFILCSWAVLTLMLNTVLKVTAAILHLRAPKADPPVPCPYEALPVITILVPLYRERDIAGALVRRLSALEYPTEKLDVCLVLEADDGTTQDALNATNLPIWMRAIKVPLGTLQTKPRALNYALSFARGSIIGVYDAEDAPAADQLHVVAARFLAAQPDVACLQGRLDFYNSHSNWLARCFTIEYATWFRIILPGLERLKLAIPLGGTTLFFRRDILEKLGGWDAHNVTEDADLGIRLARHGYRTEIIDTTTQEEANARAWPWIKQRSRWLKGYAITYMVHMRSPRKLMKDLGAWRFFGVQLLFGGTITQFLLAPVLWSFWLLLFGLPHPLDGVMSRQVSLTLASIFLGSEILGIAVSILGALAVRKPSLIPWAPTLHLYFPLAALAAYKGVIELATKPFYWDKTTHGIFVPSEPSVAVSSRPQPQPHPIAAE